MSLTLRFRPAADSLQQANSVYAGAVVFENEKTYLIYEFITTVSLIFQY